MDEIEPCSPRRRSADVLKKRCLSQLTNNQLKIVVFMIILCFSELVFSGVLNGWSALYLIFNPQTSEELSRTQWIYTIGNIAALLALIPQGILTDATSSSLLFFSHAAIGVVGYMVMIFACWLASLDDFFCGSMKTWVLFILAQSLNSICSNGMHNAIMCLIPDLAKKWTSDDSDQDKSHLESVQGTFRSIAFTVTNGFYALGPLVLWFVYKAAGVRHWIGLAAYAGITIVALIVVSAIAFFLWKACETKTASKKAWRWPKIKWRSLLNRSLIEFTAYNTVYSYFIIGFIAMMTTRTPWFNEAFSILMPTIGIFFTFFLSLVCKQFYWWRWEAWVQKFLTIAVVGCLWTFTALLYSCLEHSTHHMRILWGFSCVVYCVFNPIYYSVTPLYLNELCEPESIGTVRGLVTALSGPALFSFGAWIKNGTELGHGYVAFDTLNISLTVLVSLVLIMSNFKKWLDL
jgi:MFS family permease